MLEQVQTRENRGLWSGYCRRRRVSLWIIGAAAVALAAGAIMGWPLLVGVSTVMVLLANVLHLVSLVRLRRLVRQRGTNLCLACGYSMGGHPQTAQCPECGSPHDRRESERRLGRIMGHGPPTG